MLKFMVMIYHERLKKCVKFLLFIMISGFYPAQNITIDNKSDFPVEIEYSHKKIKIENNQKKTIIEKNRIKNLSIFYKIKK
jgi:hypothetical protein